jgi:hypothetical protein
MSLTPEQAQEIINAKKFVKKINNRIDSGAGDSVYDLLRVSVRINEELIMIITEFALLELTKRQ